MPGALTHDPITPGGGLHQTPSGGVQAGPDGVARALTTSQVAAVVNPRICPKPANVLFRFDGSVAAAVGYTVTHTGVGGTAAIDSTTSPCTGR